MATNFSQIDVIPKIKDVVVEKTIGQGAFAFVKKAYLKNDPSVAFAVKFVHLDTCKKYGLDDERIASEVLIHKKCSNNQNVIKLLDYNISKHYMWIAIELAEGGDLFDKIEPDVGLVDSELAQFYFTQLIMAVDYLHKTCGVAHRDIKPENILLDNRGNMKLADFGLATVFKKRSGTIRLSKNICGSPPYMAPDLLDRNGYRPDIADVWSCGILLFVLLTGTTPWEEPTFEDVWYSNFIQSKGQILDGSWAKIDLIVLNLLRGTLKPDRESRFTIGRIKEHKWLSQRVGFVDSNYQCNNPDELFKRLTTPLRVSLSDEMYNECTQSVQTQPARAIQNFVFSQPINGTVEDTVKLTHYDIDSDFLPAATQDPFLRENKHATRKEKWQTLMSQDPSTFQYQDRDDIKTGPKMFNTNSVFTRFYSTETAEDVLRSLESALTSVNIKVGTHLLQDYASLVASLGPEMVFPLSVAIKTIDTRRLLLTGFIKIETIEDSLKTITFVRTKGDPLEWRKLFKRVTVLCRDIVFHDT